MVSPRPPESDIWAWLADVPDPEIPVISVVDLGIVRALRWDGNDLVVTVTPTYSGCPATAVIASDIAAALTQKGVEQVTIETQVAPAWTTDWLTDAGRRKLEAYGIAAPTAAGGPAQCPRCAATDVTRVSQFGSTPCKALWRCNACLEPFDYFKCI